ncbi:MAG: ORF6N domain-containing protein [Dongiaceae bacterium]
MRPTVDIAERIQLLRGQLVLLDVDLAELYGVEPERLHELVRRNQAKFSVEFAFSLDRSGNRGARLAFTEYGVIIAATVLNCPRAVEISIHVVRAFVKMREALPSDAELARRIEALSKSVEALDAKTRRQFEVVYRTIHTLVARPAPKSRSDRALH